MNTIDFDPTTTDERARGPWSWTSRAALLIATALLFSGCAGSEYTLNPIESEPVCATPCKPFESSGVNFNGAGFIHAGRAVAVIEPGSTYSPVRHAFVGAPLYGADKRGRVYVYDTDEGQFNGLLQQLGPVNDSVAALPQPSLFGRALLGTDVRLAAAGTGEGDEVIVGSPGNGRGSYAGHIHWFYPGPAGPWTRGGVYAPPRGPGARFGFSLDAPPVDDATQEWHWAAVGAPGPVPDPEDDQCASVGHVFILEVQRSWADVNPFSVHQRIDAPPIAHCGEFGYAVEVGDFDGDGHSDLAVGAPGKDGGRVFVYRNTSGDPGWNRAFDTYFSEPPAVLHVDISEWGIPTIAPRLGASLASGRFWRDFDDRDALVAGMPNHSPNLANKYAGAVMQALFESRDLDGDGDVEITVVADPYPVSLGYEGHEVMRNPSGKADQRFGTALAIGSFASCETPQLAIGIPGFASDAGRVTIYRSGNKGLDLDDTYTTIRRYGDTSPPTPGTQFGSALAGGEIQRYTGYDDLLIGAYGTFEGAGQVTLTRAELGEDACEHVEGTFESTYDWDRGYGMQSYPFQVFVDYDDDNQEITMTFAEQAVLAVRDSDGDTCSILGGELTGVVSPGQIVRADWSCGDTFTRFCIAGDSTQVDCADANNQTTEMELEFYETSNESGAVEYRFELTLIEPSILGTLAGDCAFRPNQFEFVLVEECEG